MKWRCFSCQKIITIKITRITKIIKITAIIMKIKEIIKTAITSYTIKKDMCCNFSTIHVFIYYFVPNILSPASPNPGTIYPTSFNDLSIHAVYNWTSG